MAKTGISARRAARIRAFQVLYGLHFNDVRSLKDLERLFLETPMPEDLSTEASPDDATKAPPDKPHGFAWELVEGAWSRMDSLDELIRRFSRNWRVERIGRVELTLLRLAMFELAHRPDIPPKVVINEALDLTARFGDSNSKRFVNGILDAAAKDTETGALPRQSSTM